MFEFAALYHAFVFVVYLPYATLRTRLTSKPIPLPARGKLLKRVAFMLMLFGGFSMLVASDLGIRLLPPWHPTFGEFALGLLVLALGFGLRYALLPWLRQDVQKPRLDITPRSRLDLLSWGVISLFAGFFEEITYRGVLYWILSGLTGSPWVGAGLSAAAFALVHVQQGWRASLFIFGLAIVFQATTAITGALYMAMIVHALYDFLVGLHIVRERERNPQTAVPDDEELGYAQEA